MKNVICAAVAFTAATVFAQSGELDGPSSTSARPSSRTSAPSFKVPTTVRLVPVPGEQSLSGQYLQFVLTPLNADGTAMVEKAKWWEKAFSQLWKDSRSASVFFQVDVQTQEGRRKSDEMPISLVTRKSSTEEVDLKPLAGNLSAQYYAPTSHDALAYIKIAYAKKVDSHVFDTGLKLIPLLQPALGWPVKYASIAAKETSKQLALTGDKTLSDLLSDNRSDEAVLAFKLSEIKGFELLDDQNTKLARIDLHTKSTLLAPDLQKFPEFDMPTVLRFGSPKTVGELIGSAAAVNKLTGPGSFTEACDKIELALTNIGLTAVDRAALIAAWLMTQDFNSPSFREPGRQTSCERHTRERLKNTNIAALIKTSDEMDANPQLTAEQRKNKDKAYLRLSKAFSGATAEDIAPVLADQVKVITDIKSPSLKSEPLFLELPELAESSFEGQQMADAIHRKRIGYDRSRRNCFTLVDNNVPTLLRATCFTVDGKPVDVSLKTSRSILTAPDVLVITEMRIRRWLPS